MKFPLLRLLSSLPSSNNHQSSRPPERAVFLFILLMHRPFTKNIADKSKKDEQKSLTFFQHSYKIKLCKLKPISYCKVPTKAAGKVQPDAFPDDPLPAGFLCALMPTK